MIKFEKIKKLVALSQSPNDAEALSAIRMAFKLAADENVFLPDLLQTNTAKSTAQNTYEQRPSTPETLVTRVVNMETFIRVASARGLNKPSTIKFLVSVGRFNNPTDKQINAFCNIACDWFSNEEIDYVLRILWGI